MLAGVSETTIAPVVLTVVGLKVRPHEVKVPGVMDRAELVELTDESAPIVTMKASVVVAG